MGYWYSRRPQNISGGKEKVKIIAAEHLNVFDLLNANSLIISENALSKIKEVYGDVSIDIKDGSYKPIE